MLPLSYALISFSNGVIVKRAHLSINYYVTLTARDNRESQMVSNFAS